MPIELEKIKSELSKTSDWSWDLDSHSHMLKGCMCLSCHGDATVWWTNNMIFCDDKPFEEPDDVRRCETAGYKYDDALFISNSKKYVITLVEEVERLRHELQARGLGHVV